MSARDTKKAMVLASFCGDSLALGPHWEYDPAKLEAEFGQIRDLMAHKGRFHAGRGAGALTHYGDQTLLLLESLAAHKHFDLEDFAERWKGLMTDYEGWTDTATRQTLGRFEFGEPASASGSMSTDLSGASRIAPVVYALADDPQACIAACVAQARMTHNTPDVLAAAEFFGRTLLAVLSGVEPVAAMKDAVGALSSDSPIGEWMEKGFASTGEDSVKAIISLGQSCHVDDALPAVCHVIAKYEGSLEEALAASTMAGGDSAARNLLIGAVLGAGQGMESIPERWLGTLQARGRIEELLEELG